jgi:hypothetical protein
MKRLFQERLKGALLAVAWVAVFNTIYPTAHTKAENVIVNGGFDSIADWTGDTYTLRAANPTIDTGTYFFHGAGSSITVNQVHDLSNSQLTALTGPGLDYTMSADLFGFLSQRDNATFQAEFFGLNGGAGASLGSIALQGLIPGSWPSALVAGTSPSFQSTSGPVFAGTQSIVFSVITSGNIDGARNDDGYADNLSFDLTAVPSPTIMAFVDIKPGSFPNSVNLKSKGVLPVAILGTEEFDVKEVDIDMLRFGDPLLIDDGGTSATPLRSSLADVSGDGLLDLTLKFSTADLVDYEALGPDTIEGLLTGALIDGTLFEGMDSIRIVPPNGSNGNGLRISAVPEPTTCTLALAALCLVMNRRRGR